MSATAEIPTVKTAPSPKSELGQSAIDLIQAFLTMGVFCICVLSTTVLIIVLGRSAHGAGIDPKLLWLVGGLSSLTDIVAFTVLITLTMRLTASFLVRWVGARSRAERGARRQRVSLELQMVALHAALEALEIAIQAGPTHSKSEPSTGVDTLPPPSTIGGSSGLTSSANV